MPRREPRVALDVRRLIGNEALFRVCGAVAHDPAVDAWLAGEPADLRAIARLWFDAMRAGGDDVRELVHDGCPVACIGDVPFASVNTYARHVGVGFFRGALLDDPAGLLEGSGRRMRHVKLRPGVAFDDAALHALVRAACAELRHRLDSGTTSTIG